MKLIKNSNKFAWASQSENGTINGKKGDQNGREVRLGFYYDFGQDRVIRFRSLLRGRKCAEIAKTLAQEPFLGYGQNTRADFYNACKLCKWDWNEVLNDIRNGTIPNCNIDCSMFCACVINLAYGKELLPSCTTTRNIESLAVGAYMAQFKKVSINTFTQNPHKGDMPLKVGKHIIINV